MISNYLFYSCDFFLKLWLGILLHVFWRTDNPGSHCNGIHNIFTIVFIFPETMFILLDPPEEIVPAKEAAKTMESYYQDDSLETYEDDSLEDEADIFEGGNEISHGLKPGRRARMREGAYSEKSYDALLKMQGFEYGGEEWGEKEKWGEKDNHQGPQPPALSKNLKNKKKSKAKQMCDMNQNLGPAARENMDSRKLEKTWSFELSELKIKVRRQDSTHWQISTPEWAVKRRELEENGKSKNAIKCHICFRLVLHINPGKAFFLQNINVSGTFRDKKIWNGI